MSTFIPNFILLNLILRLLSLSSMECLEKEQNIYLAQRWREKARAAPRCSYKTIHYYRKAIARDPAFVVAHLELGEVYYDLAISYGHRDLYAQAIQSLKTALTLDPDLVEARYRLGTIYFLLRDFQRCRRELEKARRLDPDYQPVQDSLRMLEKIQSPVPQ